MITTRTFSQPFRLLFFAGTSFLDNYRYAKVDRVVVDNRDHDGAATQGRSLRALRREAILSGFGDGQTIALSHFYDVFEPDHVGVSGLNVR